MKSEIASLMELFLEEDPKKLRVMIKDRMAEVTEAMSQPQYAVPRGTSIMAQQQQFAQQAPADPVIAAQSPSMQRLMAQNPDLIPRPPVPQTPAAAMALAERQKVIAKATQGGKEEGRTSPRKF